MARPVKRYLLRLDPEVYAAYERWAADELRSVNAQMNRVLRDALRRAGRLPPSSRTGRGGAGPDVGGPDAAGDGTKR
ncbi:MAG: hypothetical protein D6683_10810 [Actinomyces sp.]|nr:MAG: hypothetical protein D6683_10810 [Actinomyces sp.]